MHLRVPTLLFTLLNPRFAKTLAGALFAAGLIMVVIGGGSCLLGTPYYSIMLGGRTRWRDLFRNGFWLSGKLYWLSSYRILILGSGQLNFSDGSLGDLPLRQLYIKQI